MRNISQWVLIKLILPILLIWTSLALAAEKASLRFSNTDDAGSSSRLTETAKPAAKANNPNDGKMIYSEPFQIDNARKTLKDAANGDAQAQYSLGYFYQYGKGIAQNDAEAIKWYKKSAENGNTDAILMMAALNSSGIMMPINKEESYMWNFLYASLKDGATAAKTGIDGNLREGSTITVLRALEAELKPEQVVSAQSRAKKIAARIPAKKK